MNTTAITAPWVDGKRRLWLLSPVLPVVGLGLFQCTDCG
jgi:hypothetical protein